MNWNDNAVVLSVYTHGETSAVVDTLTYEHGRHSGYIRGATGKKFRGILQPGNVVRVSWRGRLEEHLGNFNLELISPFGVSVMDRPMRLAALVAACALCRATIPEREPYTAVYVSLVQLLDCLSQSETGWAANYVRWEVQVLSQLGFGLDLSHCAATGSRDNLIFVSPRTGRAVSGAAGDPYSARLFNLPQFMLNESDDVSWLDVADGLKVTGFFLEKHALAPQGAKIPAGRVRLFDEICRRIPTSDIR